MQKSAGFIILYGLYKFQHFCQGIQAVIDPAKQVQELFGLLDRKYPIFSLIALNNNNDNNLYFINPSLVKFSFFLTLCRYCSLHTQA